MDKQKNNIRGLLFVGPMFVGMGLGFFFGNVPAGLFTGMGLGFALQAVFMMSERDKILAQERLPEDDLETDHDTHSTSEFQDPFEQKGRDSDPNTGRRQRES